MKISLSLAFLLNSLSKGSVHSFSVPGFKPLAFSSRPTIIKNNANRILPLPLKATEISLPEVEGPTVLLTETEIELLARNLRETIDISFLPNPIERQVVKLAITAVCEVAPVALPEGLFQELVSGNEDWEGVKEEFIRTINDQICIPIVSREVQDKIVDGICTVMFTSKSKKSAKRQFIGRVLQTTLNQDSEEEFASMLNDMIDIPIMSEEQEKEMFISQAKLISKTFEALVPESMREMLTKSSPEELQEARLNLIDRMNEKINIPLKSEKEEKVYLTKIVDFLLKRYGLAKGTKSVEEEIVDISKELKVVELELQVQEDIYAEKMEDLNGKKESLSARKAELEKMVV